MGRPPSPLYEVNPLARSKEAERGFEGFGTKTSKQKEGQKNGSDETSDKPSDEDSLPDEIEEIPETFTHEGKGSVWERQQEPHLDHTGSGDDGDAGNAQPGQRSINFNPYAQNSQNPSGQQSFQYVTDVAQAPHVVTQLKTEPVIGLGTETTGLDPVLDSVRLVTLAWPQGTGVIVTNHVPVEELATLLFGGPIKVVHNGKFDASFLLETAGGAMPETVFDTMLVDQVSHHISNGRSLKDLVKEYLDIELDKDLQASDWDRE